MAASVIATADIPSEDALGVHLVTLGCARNEVDSEELAGRLAADGFRLVAEPEAADAVLVNTCGFIEAAKKDSVDTLLAAADLKAVGPRAGGGRGRLPGRAVRPRAGRGDARGRCGARVRRLRRHRRPAAANRRRGAHRSRTFPGTGAGCCRSRPSPARRRRVMSSVPGHRARSRPSRHRVRGTAPAGQRADGAAQDRLRLRPALQLLRDPGLPRRLRVPARRRRSSPRRAGWPTEGVRELFLVSENSSSYGKDLGDLRLLEQLLAELSAVDGIEWIRVSYLQPAEMRPSLIEAMTGTDKVVPYFDLSFQHAAPTVLRRMRRFGDPDAFLALIDQIRAAGADGRDPQQRDLRVPRGDRGRRSSLLPTSSPPPSWTRSACSATPTRTAPPPPGLPGQHRLDEIEARRARVADLAEELVSQRAESRIGERLEVLVEERRAATSTGRAAHQGPEVDGAVLLLEAPPGLEVGDLVDATVDRHRGRGSGRRGDRSTREHRTAAAAGRPGCGRALRDASGGPDGRAGDHARGTCPTR